MKFKNLETALESLRTDGLTVKTNVSVNHCGFQPDAEAYDAYGRLVALVVDDTKSPNEKRIDALTEYTERDNNMTLYIIEAPLFMRNPRNDPRDIAASGLDRTRKLANIPGPIYDFMVTSGCNQRND